MYDPFGERLVEPKFCFAAHGGWGRGILTQTASQLEQARLQTIVKPSVVPGALASTEGRGNIDRLVYDADAISL